MTLLRRSLKSKHAWQQAIHTYLAKSIPTYCSNHHIPQCKCTVSESANIVLKVAQEERHQGHKNQKSTFHVLLWGAWISSKFQDYYNYIFTVQGKINFWWWRWKTCHKIVRTHPLKAMNIQCGVRQILPLLDAACAKLVRLSYKMMTLFFQDFIYTLGFFYWKLVLLYSWSC